MAALWTLGTVSIYIDSYQRQRKGVWAELQVIDDTDTTLHWYGCESPRVRLRGHFWDRANMTAILAYMEASTSRTLTGPFGLSDTLKILDITVQRIPDKTGEATASTGEFFRVEIEAIKVG